ncbi:MAG: PA14 domain-containing protein [Alteromonadaceae bacterium]|nr:PA14 domain-containing protein [Alteromonadaceae bacterium]
MLRHKLSPLACSVALITGCQSWPPQDPNRLPPTAALPSTSTLGEVQVFLWDNLSGTSVQALTSYEAFPDSPDVTQMLGELRGQTGRGDNYGSFVRGYIIAPETGLYRFFISGDDQTEFWLSPSSDPSKKSKVAEVTGWTNALEYAKYSSQSSGSIELNAGERYYFEIIHKEGGGGDHFSVAWEGPSFSREIIAGQNIASFAGETSSADEGAGSEASFRLGYSVGFLDGSEGLAFNPEYPPLDSDQDGIYDNWETVHGLNPDDPADANSDPDNDLLVAADEFLLGTMENNPDSDGDGIPDGAEYASSLDPLDPDDAQADMDGDGASNLDEYLAETDLSDPQSLPTEVVELNYAQGFVGQYFEGTDFDNFLLARQDDAIQYSAGSSGFVEGQSGDNFSARWYGQFIAPHSDSSRNYTFRIRVDDGARLYINGEQKISAWRDQGATTYTSTASLQPQQSVDILLEYYERGGAAVAQFSIRDESTGNNLTVSNVVKSPDLSMPATTDSDSDGIPDTWELRNGLSPWNNDASDINNNGGVTNLEAFQTSVSPWTLEPQASPESPTVDDGETSVPPAPTTSTATLTWTAPLTRVDGSSIPLSEIDSYEIAYGTSPKNLDNSMMVDGAETSTEITGLAAGTWYFSIRVIDTNGLASEYSDVASKQVQ